MALYKQTGAVHYGCHSWFLAALPCAPAGYKMNSNANTRKTFHIHSATVENIKTLIMNTWTKSVSGQQTLGNLGSFMLFAQNNYKTVYEHTSKS